MRPPNDRGEFTGQVKYGKYQLWGRGGKAYPYMVPTVKPLTYVQQQRTVADIEAEIRRATIPGFRAEDV